MNTFLDAFAWIFDPAQHTGTNSLWLRIGEHLAYTFVAVLLAAIIAIPLGVYIGHTGKWKTTITALSGGIRALPTLGLLILVALAVGIGFKAPLVTFVVLAFPSILTATYAGIHSVNPVTVDAARGLGMGTFQIIRRVEMSLALPIIFTGIRSAILQVVATATLAAYVSGGALGVYIFSGLATRNFTEMLGASLVVTFLAFALEISLSLIQRVLNPISPVNPAITSSR